MMGVVALAERYVILLAERPVKGYCHSLPNPSGINHVAYPLSPQTR